MKPKVIGVHSHGITVDLQEVYHLKDETAGVISVDGMFSLLHSIHSHHTSYMFYHNVILCCTIMMLI